MRKSLGIALVAFGVLGSIQACGGANKLSSNLPSASASAGAETPKSPEGVQVGISDAPSSTDVPVAERPKMNDAAKGVYAQALDAFGAGDLIRAKTLFLEAIEKDPNAYQAQYSLGVILERLGDTDALSRYRQAFTLVPDYEPALSAYGLALARKGSLGEADSFLTERHAKMPKSAAMATALAEVKSIQRDTGAAQQLAQEALKLNPNYPPAMVALARDHFRNRRLDLAQYALQAILDGFGEGNPPRDKENLEAHLIRGLIYREEGRRAAAIKEFERVLASRPDLVDVGIQLGTYYLESGNAEAAQPILERAIRYDSANVVAHLNLGDCFRLLGKVGDSKREFEWVVAKDSSNAQVHYDLGLLYLFSSAVPGMTAPQQADAAISELEKFQQMRTRGTNSQGSDVEELITRAKAKKAAVEASAAANQPASAPGSASGAASGAVSAPGASGAPAASDKAPSGESPASSASASPNQ
jgi:Tfp pilus assembly protein PilF